jgi:hypothetical protein
VKRFDLASAAQTARCSACPVEFSDGVKSNFTKCGAINLVSVCVNLGGGNRHMKGKKQNGDHNG